MGLRSRQRRLAGVTHEDSFDVETSKHVSASLDEHLQSSRRDVDEANLSWKSNVGTAGLIMLVYEAGLYYQTLVVAMHAPVNPSLCLVLKLLSAVSLLATRQYLLSDSAAMGNVSVLVTAVYVALWAASFYVFAIRFTLLQVSPVPLAYFVMGHFVVRLIGGNTKAENARAEQLKKLERVQQNNQ